MGKSNELKKVKLTKFGVRGLYLKLVDSLRFKTIFSIASEQKSSNASWIVSYTSSEAMAEED